MSLRENIPETNKRIIRQGAFFGCVICGNPIIEYAHIIPYPQSFDNSPANLVALCPTDHTKYDLGGFSEEAIREFKAHPFNEGRDVTDRFDIAGSVPIIEIGTNVCYNTPVLLVVDNKNIVSLTKENDGLTLNALFYDENNDLVAHIRNNEWYASTQRAWDIVYRTVAKNLIVRTRPRDIILGLTVSKGVVKLYGQLYYNGFAIRILPTRILVGANACCISGSTFQNCITAIEADTQKGSIGIGSPVHEHEYKDPIGVYLRQGNSTLQKRYFVFKECKFCHEIQL